LAPQDVVGSDVANDRGRSKYNSIAIGQIPPATPKGLGSTPSF